MNGGPDVRGATRPGRRRNLMWRAIQLLLQNVFAFWLEYRARGGCRLPPGGALLLINHQSFLDPLLVGVSLKRPVSYLARDNLFHVPLIGWVLRSTYVMPIRRESAGGEGLRESLRRLELGYLIGVFPEGTRTVDGRLGALKPGFIALARRGNCPVVPVGIAGAFQALPRGAAWLRPRRVRVVFGEPLSADQVRALSARGQEREFVAAMAARLDACRAEAEQWRAMNDVVAVEPEEPGPEWS